MDLVKARKRAQQAEKEKRKPEEQKAPAREESAPAAPSAPSPPQVEESAPPAPAPAAPTKAPPATPRAAPAPAAKKKAKTVLPESSRPAPDDIFMDSAFGEDLPPLDLGEEEDKGIILEPLPPRARMPAAPAEADEEWEGQFDRLERAEEVVVEERQAGVWTATPPARPPERPAPKPRPTASPARPAAAGQGKKMTVIPLKVEEDWLVNDLREPFVPAAAKVEFEGKTGAPLLPGAKADEDFFSLATEELYQHEFNRAAEGDLGTQLELLSFRLGQEIYAVRLTSIRQIIRLMSITTVPRAPDYVLGILSLRGAVIPVFDLRRRLRLGLTEPTRKSRIVVVAVGKFMVGLIVDEVMQVVRLPETKLEPPPSMLNAVEAEYIEAIGRTGAKMIILLALEKILTPVSGNKG